MENRPIDIILLTEKLAGTNDMVSVSHMIDITSRCPSPENYVHYQSIVLNQYKLRMFTTAAFCFLNEQTLEAADDF